MQRQGVATYKLRTTEVIFKETNEKGHKIQKSVANRVQSNCFLSKSRVARYFNGGLILVSLRPKRGLYLPLCNLSRADAVGTPHQALLGRRPQKNGQGLSAVSSAGFFEAFSRHLSARPSRVPEAWSRSPVLGRSPTGPGVWAARRWAQARGLGVHQAGVSMTPAGWGTGRVGRERSGPGVPRPSHAAATGPGRLPGRAPLQPWLPCPRWGAILRRQVGPRAG